jgi:glycosyltransferase involved in cell wall biosynthesis
MKILAFAYACEPDEGSEPGAGWAWSRMLAQLGEAWVITRSNNRAPIEAALEGVPERDKLRFVYVDLPKWSRFWKKGQRGIHLYYLLWQMAALRVARRLHARQRFDLAWHVTMANAWLGSSACLVGPPFVYGPVGGGVSVPFRLLPALGVRGVLEEALRTTVRGTARYANPLARLAWRRARLILVQNPETREWLPRRYRSRVEIFPNVILDPNESPPPALRKQSKRLVFAARLVPWKGGALAIRTVAQLPGWPLEIYGSGPDEGRMRRLAWRLRVADRVTFHGRVPRVRLLEDFRSRGGIFLCLSLREEAGWVVAEAINAGLPALCLDRGGPPQLGARSLRSADAAGLTAEAATLVESGLVSSPSQITPAPDSPGERLTNLLRSLDGDSSEPFDASFRPESHSLSEPSVHPLGSSQ